MAHPRKPLATGTAYAEYAPPTSIRNIMDGKNLANELHQLGSGPTTMTDRLITFMFKHYGGWSEIYISMTGTNLEEITFVDPKDLEDNEENEFERRNPDNKLASFFMAFSFVEWFRSRTLNVVDMISVELLRSLWS